MGSGGNGMKRQEEAEQRSEARHEAMQLRSEAREAARNDRKLERESKREEDAKKREGEKTDLDFRKKRARGFRLEDTPILF